MAGYTRTDTTNNIADGNIINATDLDNEFDGIQAAFNSSTGHNHDGTTGEGAPILVLGPTQDVVVGATAVTPKTTNTVDIGSSSLKFKDLFLAGNASIGGTLGVTGATTLSAALTYGGVTLSNAVTGTGNMVLSASPTLTGTISGANASLSGTLAVTGVATLTAQPILSSLTASRAVFTDGSKGLVSNAITGTGNVVMSASPTLTGTISAEALTTSSTVTLNGGTANGVAYLNGSKVLTTGSALVFNGTTFTVKTSTGGSVLLDSTTTGTSNLITSTLNNGNSYADLKYDALTHQWLIGSEQMRLTSTGLGIGTSSPTQKLDVTGAAPSAGLVINVKNSSDTGGDNTRYAGINFQIGSDDSTASIRAFRTDSATDYKNALTFWTKGAGAGATSPVERMRLDSSGNLGIGTSSPAVKLDVVGAGVFKLDGSGSTTPLILRNNNTASTQLVKLGFDSSGTIKASINAAVYGNDYMTFNVGSDTERMRIDSSGNLGIGTTEPLGKLTVQNGTFYVGSSNNTSQTNNLLNGYGYRIGSTLYGNTSIRSTYSQVTNAASLEFYVASSGTTTTEAMRITSAGNLGIGTTSPASKLQIGSVGSTGYAVSAGLAFGDGTRAGAFNTDASGVTLYASTNLIFAPGSSEKARIDSTGNVLIGRTSGGGGKLEVDGNYIRYGNSASYTNDEFLIQRDASGVNLKVRQNTNMVFATNDIERARIDTSGNFGIGTTSPTGKLSVEGASTGSALAAATLANSGLTSGSTVRLNFLSGEDGTAGRTRAIIEAVSPSGNSGALAFMTRDAGSTTEKMRLDNVGNLLVGTTSAIGGSKVISPTGFTSRSVTLTLNGTSTITVPNGCICTMAADGFPGDSAIFSIKAAGGFQGCYVMAQGTAGNIGFGTTSNPSTGTRLNVWISAGNTMSIQDVGQGARPIYLTFTAVS